MYLLKKIFLPDIKDECDIQSWCFLYWEFSYEVVKYKQASFERKSDIT